MGQISKRYPPEGPRFEAAWATAMRLGRYSTAQLSSETGFTQARVRSYSEAWIARKKVVCLGRLDRNYPVFEVIDPTPIEPARQGTAPGNMWLAARRLKSFTPTDIGAHANTEAVPVAPREAQAYCAVLLRAGYLRVVRTAVPGRREPIYRLIRDTGPRPPRERRIVAVWDDNLGEFTHLPDGGEP